MAQNTLKTSTAILWTAAYFGIMVLYTFLDIAVTIIVFFFMLPTPPVNLLIQPPYVLHKASE